MFLIGYFLSRNIKNREIQLKSNPKPKIRKLFYLIFTLNLILSLISIFSIFINGWETRDLVFNDNGIYNSFSVNIIVNFLIYPLTLACIIFFSLVEAQSRKYIGYSYILLFLLSIQTLGRFPIYYLLYFYFLSNFILDFERKRQLMLFNKARKFLVISSVFILIIYFQLSKISTLGPVDFSELIEKFFLNYHIVGFHLLDHYIVNESFSYSFPTTTLGNFGWFLHVISKNISIFSEFPNSYMELMEIYNGGFYIKQLEFPYNAFTTSILPFYADGGLWGVGSFFMLFGFISNFGSRLSITKGNVYFVAILFFLTFGIFTPIVSSSMLLVLLFLVLINIFFRLV